MTEPISLAVERLRRGDALQVGAGDATIEQIVTASQDWHSKWSARIPADAADELRVILLGIRTSSSSTKDADA